MPGQFPANAAGQVIRFRSGGIASDRRLHLAFTTSLEHVHRRRLRGEKNGFPQITDEGENEAVRIGA